MKVFEMVFSPTGGTEKVADIFAAAFGQEVEMVDLTEQNVDFSSIEVSENDVCIIAAPAYGGRVPSTAGSRISKIRGNHAKAVLIAVYGNREFDDTLVELQDAATDAGFIPIAGVGAVAEHSLVRQFGAGRPDSQDQAELEQFAAQIVATAQKEHIQSLNLPGNRPYKEYNGVPAKPVTDESCGGCGLCAEKCPVGAIPKDQPSQTNEQLCISCMRCVTVCPNQARNLSPAVVSAFTQKLGAVCAGRKPNTLYL